MAYWIVLSIAPHPSHPMSHQDKIYIKSSFSEKPEEYLNMEASVPKIPYLVPTEYSASYAAGDFYAYHQISEAEYKSASASFQYFVWSEDYASAAFSAKSGHSDKEIGVLALGRLRLGKDEIKYIGLASGTALRPKVDIKSNDFVLVFELYIANSVVQFLVDEMNRNRNSEWATKMRTNFIRQLPIIKGYLTSRQFHTNEGWQNFVQDVLFLGGGLWDHKPVIRPVWGANNRLGNSKDRFFYDFWSNLHFGYICADIGYSEDSSVSGATFFQFLDRGTGADVYDDEPAREGWQLYARNRHKMYSYPLGVKRDHILDILRRNPHWEKTIRDSAVLRRAQPNPTISEKVRSFEALNYQDQVDIMKRMFGG